MSGKTNGGKTVELYVCVEPQFGAENQKQAVIDRLTALERAGEIDSFNTHVWGREIRPAGPLEGTDYHRSVLGSLREFEDWLRRHDASTDHLFRRREVDSDILDETYTVISLPMLCLAVYDDGELSGVYPHYDAEGAHNVHECLAQLETTERSADVAPGRPSR